jgi:phage tail-like protein
MTGPSTASGTAAISLAHHFVVVIDKSEYDLGNWSAAGGLTVSWARCDYRAGDTGNELWTFPGSTQYTPIKLTRGVSADSATVQRWLASTSRQVQPLSGAIQMVGWQGNPIITWVLKQFFPTSWRIADLEATGGSRVAFETLELAHTGFLNDETGS